MGRRWPAAPARWVVAIAAAALGGLTLADCTPAIQTWSVGARVSEDEAPASPIASATAAPTAAPTPVTTPAPARTPATTPPRTAAPAPERTRAPEPPPATADPPGGVTAVGDSVMLGASPALRQAIPSIDIDAVVSRQWDRGVETVTADRTAGRLRPTLVVGLGTNGTVTAASFDAMMRAAAGARRVVIVTLHVPRRWEASDNAVLHAGVARWPQAVLADWHAASDGHPEWFAPDGFHLESAGARAMAALVAAAIRSAAVPAQSHTAGAGGADGDPVRTR